VIIKHEARSQSPDIIDTGFSEPLKMLTRQQIKQIDEALAQSGPYAEVRLIKNRGKLRFIQRLESETVVQPGID